MSSVKAEDQSSEEWLETHSVEHLQLTLQDLVDKGKIGKWVICSSTGQAPALWSTSYEKCGKHVNLFLFSH